MTERKATAEKRQGEALWYPTHPAKCAGWMGHLAFFLVFPDTAWIATSPSSSFHSGLATCRTLKNLPYAFVYGTPERPCTKRPENVQIHVTQTTRVTTKSLDM